MSDEAQKSECLSVRISAALKMRLQRIANLRHTSVSRIAVEALERMADNAEARGYEADVRIGSPVVVPKQANVRMGWLKAWWTRKGDQS